MTYYVETARPCYPQGGLIYFVHKEKGFSRDCLSPDMTAVFKVEMVKTKAEAIAAVIEYAAGFRPCVYLIMGGRRNDTAKVS